MVPGVDREFNWAVKNHKKNHDFLRSLTRYDSIQSTVGY